MITPRTPSGVLELLPRDQVAYQRFLDTIRSGYERFGFLPIETPVFELTEVLLTKSGGETENQVYFVQSTGALAQGKSPELALRFDLTVPLARYVAEHEHDLAFPFRRYQMQKVYRGERPQKGRFRELVQCDIDVIAKDVLPLHYDAEMPAVVHDIFHRMDCGEFTIRINNRKLLKGLLLAHSVPLDLHAAVLREIDKLDKVGAQKVRASLTRPELGVSDASAGALVELLLAPGSNDDVLSRVRALPSNEDLARGERELQQVLEGMSALGVRQERTKLDLAIARGLDYYTGTVYECFLSDAPGIGSISSGGRYDDLASHYTKSKLPGVGISIGATRLFGQLYEAGHIKKGNGTGHVYLAQLEEALLKDCRALAAELRAAGINTELAPEPAKVAKQIKHAERVGTRFIAFYGSAEKAKGVVALKELATAKQEEIPREQLASHVARLVGAPAKV